jgi:hypothetical protein
LDACSTFRTAVQILGRQFEILSGRSKPSVRPSMVPSAKPSIGASSRLLSGGKIQRRFRSLVQLCDLRVARQRQRQVNMPMVSAGSVSAR